ncbi:LysR family transcriptional regulator [Dyella ginsengisoli]|uniref:LysR family transcriptional regulator n=1 Tax=Dyella ginsengisoli TaxID=363848 RepID=UPI00034AD6E3|nr:LysR family transcriptional regulator [Dyella ginsengisoli]
MTERDLPPLNALRAFEATSRLQSVSRAAEALHVTHGAVSRQIRQLEEALGRPLFARQGRGLVLTEAGERLREAAGSAFDGLRDAWAALRQPSSAPFVLGCPASVLARWMIPRLDRLAHDLPGLTLHLSAQEAPPAPELRGLDAALLIGTAPWPPGWEVTPLAPERIGPVMSPRYAGTARLAAAPATSLLDEPLLHTTSRPQAWTDWAQASGLDAVPRARGQGFEHLYYLLEAALAGLGVAIAPQPLVADDLAAGRLVAPWGFVTTEAQWVLATPARANGERAAALARWLAGELREAPATDTV